MYIGGASQIEKQPTNTHIMKRLLLSVISLGLALSSIAQTTTTFNYTGAQQSFVVPPCVTQITVTAQGAQGGNAAIGGTGGLGGTATGILNVTPGQTLYIYVGGQNGYNGGGAGGLNGSTTVYGGPSTGAAAVGGGASDVRVNGTAVSDRVIVAGGGGGGGHNGVWTGCQVAGPAGNGGNGGGLVGSAGTFGVGTPCNCGGGGGGGGQGGTQVAGGLTGVHNGSTACLRPSWSAGLDGTLAQGGNGSITWYNGTGGGGGGGGGYYGGGSGASGSDTTPGGGGGGGSSWTGTLTSASTTAGTRIGDGEITLTYSAAGSLPTAPINFTGSNTICNGSTANYSIDPVATALSYTWTVSPGLTVNSGQGSTSISVTGSTGTSTISVVANNTCGAGPATTFVVTIAPNPTVNLGSDTTTCGGTVTLDAGNAGSTYLWNNASTNQTLAATTSGNYSVLITDANGCTDRDTVSVTINTVPTVSAGAASTSVCLAVDTIALSGAPSGGTWSGNAVAGSDFYVANAGVGAHTLIYSFTDSNGCSALDSVTILVNSIPVVSASAALNFVCVADNSVALTGSPVGGTWSGSGVVANQFVPSLAGTGTYVLTYTFTNVAGCTSSDTLSITVDLCTGLNEDIGLTYNVHPNPSTSLCNVTFANAQNNVVLEITDSQGRVVVRQFEKQVGSGATVSLNVENLAAGTYLLNVISTNGNSVKPMIIER